MQIDGLDHKTFRCCTWTVAAKWRHWKFRDSDMYCLFNSFHKEKSVCLHWLRNQNPLSCFLIWLDTTYPSRALFTCRKPCKSLGQQLVQKSPLMSRLLHNQVWREGHLWHEGATHIQTINPRQRSISFRCIIVYFPFPITLMSTLCTRCRGTDTARYQFVD